MGVSLRRFAKLQRLCEIYVIARGVLKTVYCEAKRKGKSSSAYTKYAFPKRASERLFRLLFFWSSIRVLLIVEAGENTHRVIFVIHCEVKRIGKSF